MQNPAAHLLSFRLRIARTRSDVLAACRVRAYGHHMPHLRDALMSPGSVDEAPGVVMLLCTDKRSGEPVGTLRLRTSFWGPLLLEWSVSLPDELRAVSRMELTRLATVPDCDTLVKRSLIKASFIYCRAMLVSHLVICVRASSRALQNQYRRLKFFDVFPDGVSLPLKHVAGMEHLERATATRTIEQRWVESSHEWLDFVFGTWHPDIDLFAGRSALTAIEDLPLAA
jgi:hypothetical protein